MCVCEGRGGRELYLYLKAFLSAGKTTLVLELLRHEKNLFSNPFQHYYWCLPNGSEPPDEILDRSDFQVHYGVPDGAELPHHSLIILDDLQHEQCQKTVLLHTVHSHHRSQTVVTLNHSLFPKNRFQRDLTQSTKYVIVCRNPRDTQAFYRLAIQLEPGRARSLYHSYLDACSRPYGYLAIDLTQKAHAALKYRSQILPTDDGMCIYATDAELNRLIADNPQYVRYSDAVHSADSGPADCQQEPQESSAGVPVSSGDQRPV